MTTKSLHIQYRALTSVSREKGQKTLCATIDHVNLMKGNCMNYLLPLLEFTFWTLHKLGLQLSRSFIADSIYLTHLRSHSIIVSCSSESTPKLGDFSCGLFYGDNVSTKTFMMQTLTTGGIYLPSLNLLLGNGFNHFSSQVIHRLHFCSF